MNILIRHLKNALKIVYKFKFFASIVFITILIKSFILDISLVPTGSMYPTIVPGDILLVTKYDYGYNGNSFAPISIPCIKKKIFTKPLQQGDIAIFKDESGKNIIKRVIGLPGQKVQLIQGTLFIDDKPIEKVFETIKLDDKKSQSAQYQERLGSKIVYKILERQDLDEYYIENLKNTYPFYVPQDQYFFLGDNRYRSKDSRYIGFIKHEKIIAKARYVIFCLKSFVAPHKHLSRTFSSIK